MAKTKIKIGDKVRRKKVFQCGCWPYGDRVMAVTKLLYSNTISLDGGGAAWDSSYFDIVEVGSELPPFVKYIPPSEGHYRLQCGVVYGLGAAHQVSIFSVCPDNSEIELSFPKTVEAIWDKKAILGLSDALRELAKYMGD